MNRSNVQAALLSLGLLIAASCNQSPIFSKISHETRPIPPKIPGAPTNMVVVERTYNAVPVSIMYVASGKLYWYAAADGTLEWHSNKGNKTATKYPIKDPVKQSGGNIISLAVDKENRLYALCMSVQGVTTLLYIEPREEAEWKLIDFSGAGDIQSIYVDPETTRLFAGVRRGNIYDIFYLDNESPELKKKLQLMEPKKTYIHDGNRWQKMVQDIATVVSIIWKGEHESPPDAPQKNWVYYNNADKTLYIYNGTEWQKLVDDVSISWKGEQESHPDAPQTNWIYYHKTEKTLYIHNGSEWRKLVDDVSIIWKGEHESPPDAPQKNWIYYNKTDKTSYIYNGTDGIEWQKLDKDGEIGPQGLKTGTAGVSITWKGESDASPPSPQANWAYCNLGSELELRSILSGTVYRKGVHYLCTQGNGIYTVNETGANNSEQLSAMQLEELPATQNISSMDDNRTFMGIIKLKDNKDETIIDIISIERGGPIERERGFLYQVNSGSFKRIPDNNNDWMKTSRYTTGALALWKDPSADNEWALIAGIQGGLSSSSTSNSSYTHGYVEFGLNENGLLDTSKPCRNGRQMQSVRQDPDQYATSLGKHPINHLFQAPATIDPGMTFFASTQTAGLWSYRTRPDNNKKDKLQWNAEN